MPLPVTLVHHDDEAPDSLCDRLSIANGFSSKQVFMKMIVVNALSLAKADPLAINRLAQWSGHAPERLNRYGITATSKGLDFQLGNAMFRRTARRGKRFRYCPNCIVQDLATGSGRPVSRPYVRFTWLTRDIVNCTAHARPLVEVPHGEDDSFCRFVVQNRAAIETQAAEQISTSFLAVDRYAEDRIRGESSEPYLDRFEAHVAIDLCAHFGRFVKRNQRARSGLPKAVRAAPSREIGYFLARQGEDVIRDTTMAILRDERSKGMVFKAIGSLGTWLRRNVQNPKLNDLVALFQDAAERTLSYAPGEVCFVRVKQRHVHSVFSASLEYKLFEGRIVQLLKTAGIEFDDTLPSGRIFFDVQPMHDILTAASKTITSKGARDILGVTEAVMAKILDSGLLLRVEGSRAQSRKYTRIRQEDLEDFQNRVFAHVAITDAVVQPFTLSALCLSPGLQIESILSALIDGKLVGVEAPVDHNGRLDALRFPPRRAGDYLTTALGTISDVVGVQVMSQRAAAAYMRVAPNTIPMLIEKQLVERVALRNPINNRHQKAITVASIDAFLANHVQLSTLAAQHETNSEKLHSVLMEIGVRPIWDDRFATTRFYRKSDIDGARIEVKPKPK